MGNTRLYVFAEVESVPEETPLEDKWQLFEKLPEDLKEAISSDKNADITCNWRKSTALMKRAS